MQSPEHEHSWLLLAAAREGHHGVHGLYFAEETVTGSLGKQGEMWQPLGKYRN